VGLEFKKGVEAIWTGMGCIDKELQGLTYADGNAKLKTLKFGRVNGVILACGGGRRDPDHYLAVYAQARKEVAEKYPRAAKFFPPIPNWDIGYAPIRNLNIAYEEIEAHLAAVGF
jgi:hypothetical protein